MKNLKFIWTTLLLVITTMTAIAHEKTDTIKVSGGKCKACKQQIEQTLKIEGISKVNWNAKTKLLVVSYDTHKIKNDEIQKKIADAGYDTEKYQATDESYNKLVACCRYRNKIKTK